MGKHSRKAPAVTSPWPWIVLVACAAVIPFLPGLAGPFVFDDLPSITQNPAIRQLNVGRFFSDPTAFSAKPGNWPYRPVTLIFNSICFAWSGDSPAGFRALQLAVHALNSLLVMLVAARVFGLSRGAVGAGLLFALAPLNSQAALYVSARGPLLAMAPALASVYFFGRSAEKGQGARIAALLAVFFAGVAFFTYEASLALPAWLVLAAWAKNIGRRQVKPWIALAGVVAMAALYLSLRAVLSPGDMLAGHELIKPDYGRLEQALLQLRMPLVMARLYFFPTGLSLLHQPSAPDSFADPSVILSAIGLMAAAAAALALRGQKPLAAGIAWYFAALLPAVAVYLNTPWAEHRVYAAAPGLAFSAGFLHQWLWRESSRKGLVTALCAACLCMLALIAFSRSRVWSSSARLFADAVHQAPGHYAPWSFLADERARQNDCRAALSYLELAIARAPDFADAHNGKVNCLIREGRLEEAVMAAGRAVELDPLNPMYARNLAVSHHLAGRTELALDLLARLKEALGPDDPLRTMVESDISYIKGGGR